MSRFITAALGLALLVASKNAIGANDKTVRATVEPRGRLLTSEEGAALVDVSLDNSAARRAPDCSHLVYQLLTAAGLSYPYAPSFAIFRGIPQFRRVTIAQPGDLIVWPGHVGLVIDPEQHTFFSRTGSGPRTVAYDSDYWRHRGRPRFYRYIVGDSTPGLLEARINGTRATIASNNVEPERPSDRSPESEAAPADAAENSDQQQVPENIHLVTEQNRPTKDDVAEGVSELASASALALEAKNRGQLSIMLLRDIRVEKIQAKGNKGWADLRVESRAELAPNLTWKRTRVQTLRWELRRNQGGWILSPPKDRVYVDQSAAIPVLAKQLSVLSATPTPASAQRQIGSLAALLDFLLNEKITGRKIRTGQNRLACASCTPQ